MSLPFHSIGSRQCGETGTSLDLKDGLMEVWRNSQSKSRDGATFLHFQPESATALVNAWQFMNGRYAET